MLARKSNIVRAVAALLAILLPGSVTGGATGLAVAAPEEPPTGGGRTEIVVSAASSLTDAFEMLARSFEDRFPGVLVRLNFSGSNHLQRQIEGTGGRGVDVFASAGAAQMDALIAAGLVADGDVRFFAGNEIVLVCSMDNSAGVHSFDDLSGARVGRIALGASRVPIGHYGEQVLGHLGLLDRLEDRFVRGIHVRQVLEYVAAGEADAGLVYATDAATMGDHVQVVARAPADWHDPIRYPIAVLKHSEHREAAERFVEVVCSPVGRGVLERFGFRPPPTGAIRGVGSAVRTPEVRGSTVSRYGAALTAMKLSLIAATAALLIVFPLGTALGALLAKRSFPGRELIDALLTLPMILPPTVTGYYLIVLLGSRSAFGETLESWFGIRVVLTRVGAGVASTVIALPLMIKSARAAFESVNRELELASYTLGKGKVETLLRVTLPQARHGLVAGAILSFARAIGEFGATFMLAGIIPGKTMTMPSAIFHAFANHEDELARFLVVVLTVFSLLVIYATNRLNARQRRRMNQPA